MLGTTISKNPSNKVNNAISANNAFKANNASNTFNASNANNALTADYSINFNNTINAIVNMTRNAGKQMKKINAVLRKTSPATPLLFKSVLRTELSDYITQHEAAGAALDENCLEVRYEDGIYVLLRKMQGEWYVTDIVADKDILNADTVAYKPVYVWQKLKQGLDYAIAHILVGWRQIAVKTAALWGFKAVNEG